MAAIQIPATLRHLATCPLRFSARFQTQRRCAQVHDVRFLATKQPSQVVLEKYRQKLDLKAKKEGLSSIDDLKTAYADRIEAQRKKDAVEYPIPDIPQAAGTPVSQPNRGPLPSQLEPGGGGGGGGGKAAIQSLDEIVDVAKIKELPEKELTAVWRLRHASSPQKLCAVIPAASYQAMEDVARQTPHFVLPVPHEGQGAEIHLLQWTFDAASRTSTVLFTQLAEYKARGEFAQPHTTVTHHLDLLNDKGVVLMQGQTMPERGVSLENAKWLVLCLQRFYGAWNGAMAEVDPIRNQRAAERRKLVEWFGTGDSRFSVEKLLEEAERLE
ncbi:hypothetical protein E4U43_001119 [Claviceps pusilla]|uniref:F1F0-ATPase complex assembly protein ATP11 n=1 Tax=Claviceps pusilla TaxID=123648 RepID=A0A9P7NAR1_9HYPO|nr:hypothetical protein E4U43_001119 [Claviceps pusilla]